MAASQAADPGRGSPREFESRPPHQSFSRRKSPPRIPRSPFCEICVKRAFATTARFIQKQSKTLQRRQSKTNPREVQAPRTRKPRPSTPFGTAPHGGRRGARRSGSRPATPYGKGPHPGGSARIRRIYALRRGQEKQFTRAPAACPPPCRRPARTRAVRGTRRVASTASPARWISSAGAPQV